MPEKAGTTFYYPERARTYYSPDGRVIGRTTGRGGYFTPESLAKHNEVIRIQEALGRLLTLDEIQLVGTSAIQDIVRTETGRKEFLDSGENPCQPETSVLPPSD